MKHHTKYHALAASLMLFICTGCWPYHFIERPGATGVVIDAENKSPIVGAAVKLNSSGYKRETYAVSTVTEADGRFLLKPKRFWAIYIVPGDPALLRSAVTITANGYAEMIKDFRVITMGTPITDLGVIEMQRQNKTDATSH